jgi:hypothetical protein
MSLENITSETESVSIFRWREGDTLLGLLESANFNHSIQWLSLSLPKWSNRVGEALPSPGDGNSSSFRCFLVILEPRTMDKENKRSDSEWGTLLF